MDHGYAAVTMEDIARAAGVTRPIVYRHFETKEGAYIACVARARAAYQAGLMAVLDPTAPAKEQLRIGAERFFAMLEEDAGRWKLLFGSNAVLPGEFTDELAELRFGTIRLIHLQLRSAAPGTPEPLTEAAAHAISGVGERLGHWWLTRPELTRDELVELYTEFVWNGVKDYVGPTDAGPAPRA